MILEPTQEAQVEQGITHEAPKIQIIFHSRYNLCSNNHLVKTVNSIISRTMQNILFLPSSCQLNVVRFVSGEWSDQRRRYFSRRVGISI